MLPNTLKFKMGMYVAIALTGAMLLFAFFVIKNQRDQSLRDAVSHLTQISEVIIRSIRYAMLQNQPDYVLKIIQDVGHQENIVKVRILSKEGRIIHSTFLAEIGQTVDRKADACIQCHQGAKPLEQIPQSERSRIYEAPNGGRLLGSMEVIRNEPSCYTAACHHHTKAQSVLGVLDIVYSLARVDRSMELGTLTIGASSIAFLLVAALFVFLFVHRLVYLPLRDLTTGASRPAAGDLEQMIPVRSGDEFGQLATSFNAMIEALKKSQAELREWAHTLEQKVELRTRELRIAEAKAAQSAKLAAVGMLASGIAHELNNPLTGILTFATLLRRKMPEGSPDAEDLDLVIRETRRCAAIIRRLLDFAREKKPEKNYSDLNRIIEDTVRIIERPASFLDVEIALELDTSLPHVWLDADLIRQVVMNVLVNAQHAISQSGKITVRTRRCSGPVAADAGELPVPMVEIAITDTGCGIPAENLTRIFDPFFTSKEVGKGTGLGLAVSHGIVKSHGGKIEVESEVGKGSTFRVFLPLEPLAKDDGAAGSGGAA